jgi:hypothetical protein
MAVEIRHLGRSLEDIPAEALFKAKFLADEALLPMTELAKHLTPEVAVSAGALVDEAERYMITQSMMGSFDEDAFAQMVVAGANAAAAASEAGGGAGAGGEGAGGGHDVVLVLNERELGRAIEVFMNKRINLSIS